MSRKSKNNKSMKNINSIIKAHIDKMNPDKKVALVGLPATVGEYKDGDSIVMIGAMHEFGSWSKNIPKRSFLREPLNKNKDVIISTLKVSSIEASRSPNGSIITALNAVGEVGVSISKNSFYDNDWEKLKNPSKKRGGSSAKPLLDTGTLSRSITYEIGEIK